ncbi:hypothetical protein ACFE04_018200 [Oxalis oulophora]
MSYLNMSGSIIPETETPLLFQSRTGILFLNSSMTRVQNPEAWIDFPMESDFHVQEVIENEVKFFHGANYVERYLGNSNSANARRHALDYLSKMCENHKFGTTTYCLAVNYFDRFCAGASNPNGYQPLTLEKIAISVLVIAAKLAEPFVPALLEFQIRDAATRFQVSQIQRTEILILHRLRWNLRAPTPWSYIEYFLTKIINDGQRPSYILMEQSLKVLMKTFKGIGLLIFKPSEIAAGVAICVSKELLGIEIDDAAECLIPYLNKEKMLQSANVVNELLLVNENDLPPPPMEEPDSPTGVLDTILDLRTVI